MENTPPELAIVQKLLRGELPAPENVDIGLINIDATISPRHEVDAAMVDSYAQLLSEGVDLGPLVIFRYESCLSPADGLHRLAAERQNGSRSVSAIIIDGSRKVARLYALGRNVRHGKPLSLSERTSAARERALDPAWAGVSCRAIGRLCGVSHTTVAQARSEANGKSAISGSAASAADNETASANAVTKIDKQKGGKLSSGLRRAADDSTITPATPSKQLHELESAIQLFLEALGEPAAAGAACAASNDVAIQSLMKGFIVSTNQFVSSYEQNASESGKSGGKNADDPQ